MYETNPERRKTSLLFVDFDYSVNYWNVSSFNFKNNNFTSSDWVFPEICEEQEVSPVEGWLHAATRKKHKVNISEVLGTQQVIKRNTAVSRNAHQWARRPWELQRSHGGFLPMAPVITILSPWLYVWKKHQQTHLQPVPGTKRTKNKVDCEVKVVTFITMATWLQSLATAGSSSWALLTDNPWLRSRCSASGMPRCWFRAWEANDSTWGAGPAPQPRSGLGQTGTLVYGPCSSILGLILQKSNNQQLISMWKMINNPHMMSV